MNHSDSSVVVNAPSNPQEIVERDGKTYDHERDGRRLAGQHARVLALMRDGKWRTLAEISLYTRDPESSVSARLRDLRKPKFGGHAVEREYVENGLHRYRVIVRPELVLVSQ